MGPEQSTFSRWFSARYGEPTPAQKAAWPLIAAGRNVLIASPTGTGKTFAAFFSILDTLAREHEAGQLQSAIQCLYISPLRALGYDLEKNLFAPIQEIYGDKGPIRVELRSGDTSTSKRQRQYVKPPHVLLSTPESICVLLSQEKWLPLLAGIRWVIVDEIHALADNKRGVHLSLSLERIAQLRRESGATPPLQRIGLSATVAPLPEVAKFLVGSQGECDIVDVSTKKRVELRVHTPLRKNPYPEAGYTGQRLIRELGTLIQKHQTTLVFCNVRSGAEAVTYWLRENFPKLAGEIECHHGSLDRDVRREVEDRLKRGELRAVVCSTSLELGIDIGAVELVVMMSTPKGVSKALQRAGRAGHNIHATSRGVLMATNVSDLVEACATVLLARTRQLEEVRIPEHPLDVLAQHLVSMGCGRVWQRSAAFALVRTAYPFQALPREEFDDVLDYLAGGGASLRAQYTDVFGKILLDDDSFETRPGKVRRDFLQNVGVIPEIGSVRVRTKTRNLGTVEEAFIQMLKIGDIFMVAGHPVRLERVLQMDAIVTPAPGATPTVPRWNASKLPLSNRVCEEIASFRGELRARLEAAGLPQASPFAEYEPTAMHPDGATRLRNGGRWARPVDPAPDSQMLSALLADVCAPEAEAARVNIPWIAERLECGASNAAIVWEIHAAQHLLSEIPTADFLLIEELRERVAPDEGRNSPVAIHYLVHSLIGRAANDALARVLSYRMSQLRGGNAIATAHDYGFVLTVAEAQRFAADDLPRLLSPRGFREELEAALKQSEMLKYHFRNAAQTGLMVYRNYFDEKKPMRKLAWSSEVIFNVLQQYEPEHVLMREARRDTLRLFLDADGALAFLEAQAHRPARIRQLDRVPPLSFSMYATKIKEALLVEDPYETMERLYHQWWGELKGGSGSGEAERAMEGAARKA